MKVSYPTQPVGGGMGTYDDKNQPYLDFMKEYVQGDPTATGKHRLNFFMQDADNQAAIIRGMGVPIPPETNKGHFHIGNDEFWFILEGKIAYQIEGVGLIVPKPAMWCWCRPTAGIAPVLRRDRWIRAWPSIAVLRCCTISPRTRTADSSCPSPAIQALLSSSPMQVP